MLNAPVAIKGTVGLEYIHIIINKSQVFFKTSL